MTLRVSGDPAAFEEQVAAQSEAIGRIMDTAKRETLAGAPKQNCDRGRDEVGLLRGTENTPGIASTALRAWRGMHGRLSTWRRSRPRLGPPPRRSGQGEQQVRSPTLAVSFR